MNYLHDLEIYLKSKNYAKSSIDSYLSCAYNFLYHFKKSPQNITIQEIRIFLSELSYAGQKQTVGALRILYSEIVPQPRKLGKIQYPRKPSTLPKVFSREEIDRILFKTSNIKHKCMIHLGYSSGLRLSEVLNLKPTDILSDRMQIFVKGGKGMKDRYTVLSKHTLQLLRSYYKEYRPSKYLFEGQNGGKYSSTSVQNIMRKTTRKGTFHTLRHSFATHLIEQGTPTIIVQMLMGHNSPKTTEIYTKLAKIENVISPFDVAV